MRTELLSYVNHSLEAGIEILLFLFLNAALLDKTRTLLLLILEQNKCFI